jgi:hypothetical protein
MFMKTTILEPSENLSAAEKKEFLFRFLLVGIVVLFSILAKEVAVLNDKAAKSKPISLRVR